MTVRGRVVQQHKSLYHVDTGEGVVAAVSRGTLKGRMDQPCVGDVVTVRLPRGRDSRAVISDIEPRRNRLSRPVIANVDQAIFVATLRQPAVDRDTIDRFLVMLEDLELGAALVFNKLDLLDSAGRTELERTIAAYAGAGYRCAQVCAAAGEGRDTVMELCRGKVSTLAGPSGVGKSTLLNALAPELDLQVSEVSARTEAGVHTTTATTLLKLAPGTYLADTPGFAAIALPRVDKHDLQLLFPELRARIGSCRFNDCLHSDEPGCTVREQAGTGGVDTERYASYRRFLEEVLLFSRPGA